jgi:uncharacterized YigZ family protein
MSGAGADAYVSLDDGPQIEIRVKASRFFARAFRSDTRNAAQSRLDEIRKRAHDATHHCWAWRGAPESDPVEVCDDDGEPSGTAGLPILGALRREDTLDALVVVTRYFGGTKLGTGGLVRAYGDAAREAIEAAPRRIVERVATLVVDVGYDDLGAVEAVLARSGPRVRGVERTFEPTPRLLVRALRSSTTALVDEIVELTGGRASVAVEAAEG